MVDYVMMGKRMRVRRKRMHLTQQQVADAVRITPSYYGNIERGNRIPSIDTLVDIANVLKVGTDYLLAESVKTVASKRPPDEIRLLSRYLREKVEELDYGDRLEDVPEEPIEGEGLSLDGEEP